MRPAVYEAIKDSVKVDTVVLAYGEIAEDTFNGGIKLDAEQIVTLAEARVEKARAIKLSVNQSTVQTDKISELKILLGAYSAEVGLPVVIDYTNQIANVQMKSHDGILYLPEDDLLEALTAQGWQPEVVL